MNSPDYSLKPASEHTRALNSSAATPLDPEDFTRAQRGFIASLEDTKITDALGRQAGDIGRYDFLKGDAPDTVHPNLWRHAKLNVNHGLFEVTEGVWQVRGYDIYPRVSNSVKVCDISEVVNERGETQWALVHADTQQIQRRTATAPTMLLRL